MKSRNGKKNILIWAVDPMQRLEDSKNLIKEMSTWAEHLDCAIQPVSIISNRTFNLPSELSLPWTDKVEQEGQNSLDHHLDKLTLKDVLPLERIFTPSNSTRKMVAELAKYAEKRRARIICANTRARKSWNPFRIGGFAENLIVMAKTPVLLLNPDSKPSVRIPSVLFPTDFSRESKAALKTLVPWAKAFQSKVVLYNQLETSVIYGSEFSGFWPATSVSFLMKDIEKSRKRMASQWSKSLADHNVRSEILIRNQKRSLDSDILESARKNKVRLIALASLSGSLSRVVLGSVARDVLLQAKCPVLIFHSPKVKIRTAHSSGARKTERSLKKPHTAPAPSVAVL